MRLPRLLATASALLVVSAAPLGCGGGSGSEKSGPPAGASPPEGRPAGGAGAGAPPGAVARVCAAAEGAQALRVVGVGCGSGRRVMTGWTRSGGCAVPPGASRAACTVAGYRCLSARTAAGVSVGCSRPGRSISFAVDRR